MSKAPALLQVIDAKAIGGIAFSPDGKCLAAGYANRSDNEIVGGVRIWSLKPLKLMMDLTAQSGFPMSIAISPDGRFLASNNSDRSINAWDYRSGKLLHAEVSHTATLSLAFSTDGKFLASVNSSSDAGRVVREVSLTDTTTWLPVRRLKGNSSMIFAFAFSPDNRWLISGGEERVLSLWELDSGQLHRKSEGHKVPTYCLTFSADGTKLAAGGWNWNAGRAEGEVVLWDFPSMRVIKRFTTASKLESVAISSDAKLLAASGKLESRQVAIWDIDTGEERWAQQGRSNKWLFGMVVFSPTEALLGLAKTDGPIELYGFSK